MTTTEEKIGMRLTLAENRVHHLRELLYQFATSSARFLVALEYDDHEERAVALRDLEEALGRTQRMLDSTGS